MASSSSACFPTFYQVESVSEKDADAEIYQAMEAFDEDDGQDSDGEEKAAAPAPAPKKKSRGRKKVAHDQLQVDATFRGKFNTALSNAAYLAHQTGAGVVMILTKNNFHNMYMDPHTRDAFRQHPELEGALLRVAEDRRVAGASVNRLSSTSYSRKIPYTSRDIEGNSKDSDGVLGKRKIDTYAVFKAGSIPLRSHDEDDEDDGQEDELSSGIVKRLIREDKEKNTESKQKSKDMKKAEQICSLFAEANIVPTGQQGSAKPSLLI